MHGGRSLNYTLQVKAGIPYTTSNLTLNISEAMRN